MFKFMAGIDMVLVQYRSGRPAITDPMSGQVHAAILGPSMKSYRGYEASQWFRIAAPKRTAPEIVNQLNAEINAGFADEKLLAPQVEPTYQAITALSWNLADIWNASLNVPAVRLAIRLCPTCSNSRSNSPPGISADAMA
jgi:tripartite-type tricarboxylate transporter receptor subunit TctC